MGIMRQIAAASSESQTQPQSAAGQHTRRRSNRQQPDGEELFNSFLLQYGAVAANSGASGFEAIAANISRQGVGATTSARSGHQNGSSPLRHKLVYQLRCTYCAEQVCNRAMKAILLADTKIELYSTDIPPDRLVLLDDDRMTQGCHCRIRDTVCGGCGNVLGYHVSQPCERCLDAKNNGHFWMFYSETIQAWERLDPRAEGKPLYWGALSPMRDLEDIRVFDPRCYETICR